MTADDALPLHGRRSASVSAPSSTRTPTRTPMRTSSTASSVGGGSAHAGSTMRRIPPLRLGPLAILSLLVAITPVLANVPAANRGRPGPCPFRGRRASAAFAAFEPRPLLPPLGLGTSGCRWRSKPATPCRGRGRRRTATVGPAPSAAMTSGHRFPRPHSPAPAMWHPARVPPSMHMRSGDADDGDGDDVGFRMGRGRRRSRGGAAALCHRVARSVASRLRSGTGSVAIGEGGDDHSKSSSSAASAEGMTGRARPRPDWACDWMPTWLITMRPLTQFAVGAALYVFHLTVLTQHGIAFPFQLIPNDDGHFQSIGLDSLAGMASMVGWAWLRRRTRDRPVPAVPPLWEEPYYDQVPWSPVAALRRRAVSGGNGGGGGGTSTKEERTGARRRYEDTVYSTMRAAFWLLASYGATGQFAMWCESMLYRLAGMGVPMTVAMHRSLVVLLGHLCWVGVGCLILRLELTPNFFRERAPKGKGRGRGRGRGANSDGGRTEKKKRSAETGSDDSSSNATEDGGHDRTSSSVPPSPASSNGTSTAAGTDAVAAVSSTSAVAAAAAAADPPTKWYTNKWDTYWLWWVIGGYFVSSWLFNVADFVNQVVLPRSVFDTAGEGVVSQLINPENNDLAASVVGYIAPCCSAPVWEEVLYRGYMLPALCLHMTFWPAVVVSGLIFSAHHMSATGFIPLTVLGMTWAALYAKSRNLLVTIIIHAMWNSRVFLGSWLGL